MTDWAARAAYCDEQVRRLGWASEQHEWTTRRLAAHRWEELPELRRPTAPQPMHPDALVSTRRLEAHGSGK